MTSRWDSQADVGEAPQAKTAFLATPNRSDAATVTPTLPSTLVRLGPGVDPGSTSWWRWQGVRRSLLSLFAEVCGSGVETKRRAGRAALCHAAEIETEHRAHISCDSVIACAGPAGAVRKPGVEHRSLAK
jgi:hypothetical protein